jgi:phosphatidylserine/phosphatidylglycerophosphate/cardiolipin synthase-like enzyme
MESAMVKSGFENKDTHKTTNVAEDRTGTVTSTSFLKFLPPSAPDYAATERITPLVFLQTLLDTAALYGEQYQVRWWCARDATHGYRVKNHSKSIVVDGQVAIMGGSNLAPQLNAATTEVDLILTGPVARDVSASTAALWKAASAAPPANTVSLSAKESWVPLPKNGDDKAVETPLASRLQRFVEEEAWADDNCHVAIVRSQPSQTGEDDIFRVILGAMHTATKSITMCFGHSGYPRVVAEALALASARNVRCQIIVNSYYSNDLRGGQRDLFISLRDILEIAPKTEIYVTAPKNGAGPPFLHSKYIVIDSKWSACGSFNLWTRSSFFEIEHEAMIESEIIAKQLEEKFECEKETFTIPLATPEDALRFMPDECCICPGFGPFFKE